MADFEDVAFNVERNEKVGRYGIANRDLKKGDIILVETPFVHGPKSDCPPICLGCYKPVNCSTRCSTCGWPVCGKSCEKKPAHRHAECVVFSKAKVKFQPTEDTNASCPQYECITPLRVLLAKETNPERWAKEIVEMQAHNEFRKQESIWNFNQVNVVEYLRGPCKLADRFSEDLIHTVCGYLEINSFEARSISGYCIRCLYPKFGILSHNCVSNTAHLITSTGKSNEDDFKVEVRASVDIKNGGEIFSSYTYSLWPTIVRREFLKASKYFDCTCARCADPTELGTHLGTLKCMKCDNGIITSTDPLDAVAIWKCSHCEFFAKGESIRKAFAAIQRDLDTVEEFLDGSGIEYREQLCKKYKSVLHPQNSYKTILNSALVQMYGNVEGYTLNDLPDILLERKVELCQQLLKICDVIEPGYTRIRATTLYELQGPLILLARNLYNSGTIDKEGLRAKLLEAIAILEEATLILNFEPPCTAEGKLGKIAQRNLTELKRNLDDIIENA